MTLLIVGLVVSVYAAKPGSTGNQSTGSLNISLHVPTTIRAHKPTASSAARTQASFSQDYLCIETGQLQIVSLYVMTYNQDGSQKTPVAYWTSTDSRASLGNTSGNDCGLQAPLGPSNTYPPGHSPVTLIVAPE